MDLAVALDLAQGGTAKLWEYHASLSEATLRVFFSHSSENFHFIMNGCTRINALTAWTDVALEVEESDSHCFVVSDVAAGFLVECGVVRAFRNVEPRFRVEA